MTTALFSLLFRDLIFLAVLAAIVAPICIAKKATFAVLKRNFVGYFSNPTGYVFLCLFVWLTSFAAFWPHEFFNANLANLNQLNRFLPYIMMIFIPAITMSIWAEERRQGTDELLLTLPAGDFDIVVGKYLAAASIFTASLLFSQVCNFIVLVSLSLGDLDVGLFFATYLGYWLLGMAMLAVGMVASFLTSNLTVGFILGALFNAPLVFAANADLVIPSSTMARLVAGWSLGAQFDDFGRGVISLASVTYFVMVAVLGLYLSMVLIGSRHWSGGRDGTSLLGHFLVRTVCLIAVALGVTYVFANNQALSSIRRDMTRGQVASLSPETRRLMRELDAEHTVNIEAFISGQVPEIYAKTRADLLSMLKEFSAMAGSDRVNVIIHILDEGHEDSIEIASLAEDRFGILPQPVRTRTRGTIRDDEIFLGAAFTCGLEKVVVPFFDYGVPVEYELIRSISTVARAERKRVGVVRTPAQLFGGFTMAGGQPRNIPKQAIIEELEKQYDVVEIDANNPIETDNVDVMMVVQPSSLSPEEFDHVLDVIRAGQPSVVFEDPRPVFLTLAPPTGEMKQAPGGMGGMFGGGGGPQPKGDIQQLWNLLGLQVPGQTGMMGLFEPDLVWQRFNPYPKLQIRGIPDEWVFVRSEAQGDHEKISSESPITRGLNEIFFPVPGVIQKARDSELKFETLVQTGAQAGLIAYRDFMESQGDPYQMQLHRGSPTGPQILAARIRGTLPPDELFPGFRGSSSTPSTSTETAVSAADEAATETEADQDVDQLPEAADEGPPEMVADPDPVPAPPEAPEIDVVYITDIDLLMSAFVRIRARPDEDEEIKWNFENVTFVLNIIDVLSGDDQFIEIRRRKPYHSTLQMVELQTQAAQRVEHDQEVQFQMAYDEAVRAAEEENRKEIENFERRLQEMQEKQRQAGGAGIRLVDVQKAAQDLAEVTQRLSRRLDVRREQLRRERDDQIELIRRQTDLEILKTKNQYKVLAVTLPPIPPLLIGFLVFVRRRLREREGIARSRMR
ncbi:MAG: ABC transporter permease [Planctomycetaceae bacterium]|nr:MAG: ABC transporter permease [Planctomycetaceae bacterium]